MVLTVNSTSTSAVPQFAQLTDTTTFDIYELDSINFNWKSEHQIDSVNSEMEIQFIHFNIKYGSTMEQVDQFARNEAPNLNAFAVLSIMVEESKFNNEGYEDLLRYLYKVYPDQATKTPPATPPLNALLPNDTLKFYSYQGSFTNPGLEHRIFNLSNSDIDACLPYVKWFIFEVSICKWRA